MPNWNYPYKQPQTIFRYAYGRGPFPCHFCGETVYVEWDKVACVFRSLDGERFALHHKDENRDNNDPTNLAMSHGRCHTRYHKIKNPSRGSRKCPAGCTCKRHLDYSHRRDYFSNKRLVGKC